MPAATVRVFTRIALAAAALAFVASCADNSTAPYSPPPRLLTTITVGFTSPTVKIGSTILAFASGFDQDGQPFSFTPAWQISDVTGSGNLDGSGHITGVAAGTVTITAIALGYDNKSGSATLTVVP